MPTTTTNIGLTKPDVGGSDGVWGTNIDADYDLIDAEVVKDGRPGPPDGI